MGDEKDVDKKSLSKLESSVDSTKDIHPERKKVFQDDAEFEKFREILMRAMAYEVAWTRVKEIECVKRSGVRDRLLVPELRVLSYLLLIRVSDDEEPGYVSKSTLSNLYYKKNYVKKPTLDSEAPIRSKRKATDFVRTRMDILCESGLVERIQEGRTVSYRATRPLIKHFKDHVVNGPFGDHFK